MCDTCPIGKRLGILKIDLIPAISVNHLRAYNSVVYGVFSVLHNHHHTSLNVCITRVSPVPGSGHSVPLTPLLATKVGRLSACARPRHVSQPEPRTAGPFVPGARPWHRAQGTSAPPSCARGSSRARRRSSGRFLLL